MAKGFVICRLLVIVLLTTGFAGAQQSETAFTDIPYKTIAPDSTIALDIFLPESSALQADTSPS